MKTVVLAGGSGSVGSKLTDMLLDKNYNVIVLTRSINNKKWSHPSLHYAEWNPDKDYIDINAIVNADCIINLSGASIGEKKWTKSRRSEIVESRIHSTRLLVKTLRENDNNVKTFVNASAIGWYPADTIPIQPYDESIQADNDFLGNVCHRWEESADSINPLHIRLVIIRTGLVLEKNRGIIKEFMKPLRYRIAMLLGSGKQMMSWIHINDLCRIYIQAIENESMRGVYNAAAPYAVSQRKMITTLASLLYGDAYITTHAPAIGLKIALGKDMAQELVLKSITVSARKIIETGFKFQYPKIADALSDLT